MDTDMTRLHACFSAFLAERPSFFAVKAKKGLKILSLPSCLVFFIIPRQMRALLSL